MLKLTLIFSSLLAISLVFAANLAAANEPEGNHSEGEKTRAATNLFPPKKADKIAATRPMAPALVGPEYMTTVTNGSTVLKWMAVEGTTNYHFQLATDSNFKWLVVNEPLFTGTSYEAKGLEAGKHYYWRVAAQNGNNDAAYTKSAFNKSMFVTK